MSWRPIVTDAGTTARVRAVLADIAEALRGHDGNDDEPDEPADHALMRTYLASDDTVLDDDGVAGAALARCVERVRRVHRPSLFGGVARIGWTISHLADPEAAEAGCASVDQALARILDGWTGDYDLIGGVVGFGVYALERGPSGAALVEAVLGWLEANAVERHGGLAWFTRPELLVEHQREMAPDGYWNLGVAHGMPGVVGMLARFVANGVCADRALALLELAVVHLIGAEPGANEPGRFRAWQPAEAASPRLAWCYGDLGVAATLVGTGLHVDQRCVLCREVDDDVRRLDVAVDDAGGMRGGERGQHLARDRADELGR